MRHRSKKIISYMLAFSVGASAAVWIGSKFIHFGKVEFTDNAQICRQIVPVNSRIQGYIKEIRFNEYQSVKKGDTLVIIDDSDMRLRVAQANADYRNALSGRKAANERIDMASAGTEANQAAVTEAKVLMENAAAELIRHEKLLELQAVTKQQYDAVKTDYQAKKARYELCKRQYATALSAMAESRERAAQDDAGVELAEVLLETARLNLSYTVIVAPCNGFTSRKEIQTGQLVQAGQTLLDVVDAAEIWVTANYKETQLRHIAPGSKVRIKVDALPNITFMGEVTALSKATGASLSLLPQDNSAGNFVKVRQRVPVRIGFLPENDPDALAFLRAGMNVECEVKY